jgi:hypothetical protein
MMQDSVIIDEDFRYTLYRQEQGVGDPKAAVKEARFNCTTKNVNSNLKRF